LAERRRARPRAQTSDVPPPAAPPPEPLSRVLVIAVHPDDPEFGAGGTIAKWARAGRQVDYLLITSGDKGSHDRTLRPEDVAAMREREQRAAADALGVRDVLFLRHADGVVENNLALRRELMAVVREREPHIVVTIDPWRRYQLHPDHRACGWAALDAVWAAREWNIFPEQIRAGKDPWRVKEVYLFWTDNADHWEDVGETVEQRIASLAAHQSQTGTRMEQIRERILAGCRETGAAAGVQYAESFKLLRLG
jgi:LmbE family N-acetylglucosaminyl deacetylase